MRRWGQVLHVTEAHKRAAYLSELLPRDSIVAIELPRLGCRIWGRAEDVLSSGFRTRR
jgi:hypothetical protein